MLKWILKRLGVHNYAYDILEHTPILHDDQELWRLYKGANREQKVSIMLHLSKFSDITMGLKCYRDLYNRIYDDLC